MRATYIGNKNKLSEWIFETILQNTENCSSFFDIFAGTGIVTKKLLEKFDLWAFTFFSS